jgi:hypothetical protein
MHTSLNLHLDQHRSGFRFYLREEELIYVSSFNCKMSECIHQAAYMAGRILKATLSLTDRVAFDVLGSHREVDVIRRQANRRNLWYVHFSLESGERPIISPPGIVQGPSIDVIDGIKNMAQTLQHSSLTRIGKSKTLEIQSDWQYLTDVKEKDSSIIKECLAELGVHNGKIAGPTRYWAPERLASAIKLSCEGVDPGQVLS